MKIAHDQRKAIYQIIPNYKPTFNTHCLRNVYIKYVWAVLMAPSPKRTDLCYLSQIDKAAVALFDASYCQTPRNITHMYENALHILNAFDLGRRWNKDNIHKLDILCVDELMDSMLIGSKHHTSHIVDTPCLCVKHTPDKPHDFDTHIKSVFSNLFVCLI